MISPEILRRYPFFSFLDPDQLREVAMITEEVSFEKGETLFKTDEKADDCYLLMIGGIELRYVVADELDPELRKEFAIGVINPGEFLGISAAIEPNRYTATAITTGKCKLLHIDGVALRDLCEQDPKFNCGLQTMLARTAIDRLHATRVQLAAATKPS
jgi:CRP/FNR family cyclic AMP-dependent transcriptional regulator